MPYSTTFPPFRVAGGINQRSLWYYYSVDAPAMVDGAGYITNGWDLGMRAGDIVVSINTSAAPITSSIHIVTSASAAGGVNLSDGTAITATNTD